MAKQRVLGIFSGCFSLKWSLKGCAGSMDVHFYSWMLVCNIATYCIIPGCLCPPLACVFINRLAIFCPNSHFFWLSRSFDQAAFVSQSLEMPARLAAAADFCQRLSLNTSHIMFWGRRSGSPAKRGAVQQQMAPDRGPDRGSPVCGPSSVCFEEGCRPAASS